MNTFLVSLLNEAIAKEWVVTPQLAVVICNAANQLATLIPQSEIDSIDPEWRDGCTFAVENIEDIVEEMKPLHFAHWKETEEHRHGLPFSPDYETFIRYERAGRYVLFTLRIGEKLVGNCAMYLDRSTHTQTLIATEDTLYLLPEARQGRTAMYFVSYCEKALQQLGAREICVSVKVVNRAGRFFRMLGYKHVENGLTKILEDDNVRP